jgi:hypothetical protein
MRLSSHASGGEYRYRGDSPDGALISDDCRH